MSIINPRNWLVAKFWKGLRKTLLLEEEERRYNFYFFDLGFAMSTLDLSIKHEIYLILAFVKKVNLSISTEIFSVVLFSLVLWQ